MPDVSLDRARPDAVRLLPFDVDEPSMERDAAAISAHPVSLLDEDDAESE